MNDLFEKMGVYTGEPRENPGERFRGSSPGLSKILRTPEPGITGLTPVNPRSSPVSKSFAKARATPGKPPVNLLLERSRLENEIEVYEIELQKALKDEAPYRRAWTGAKNVLHSFYSLDHFRRTQERTGATEDIFTAHNAYVVARYAWWPYGKPVQELERALNQIRRELRIVNAEIGK